MDIEYDPAKSERNIKDRGLSFELAREFDFESAYVWQDTREAYPEVRYAALGFIGTRLCFLCFSETGGGIRVISLRKATSGERKHYEKLFQNH
jgi:uncharacterized DUF497 family protein